MSLIRFIYFMRLRDGDVSIGLRCGTAKHWRRYRKKRIRGDGLPGCRSRHKA